jgi:hypothetical protein
MKSIRSIFSPVSFRSLMMNSSHASLQVQRFDNIPGHDPNSVFVPLPRGLYISPPHIIADLVGLRHSPFSIAGGIRYFAACMACNTCIP